MVARSMDNTHYRRWRKVKLDNYPASVEELCVDIGGLRNMTDAEKASIIATTRQFNMCIYRCRDLSVGRAPVREFAGFFGLHRPDMHLCANDDGVSELSVAASGVRHDYVPYSNRGLSWHTDGYYNEPSRQVRSVVLHCAVAALSLIHISEPTRPFTLSRMPSSA